MLNIDQDVIYLLSLIAFVLHLLGLFSATQAVMKARTPQGAIAWAISLIAFPYVSLPLFWIFGRDRFLGYSIDRQVEDSKLRQIRKQAGDIAPPSLPIEPALTQVLEDLAKMHFTGGNNAQLCINGQETFDQIFKAIEEAKDYLLVQFFIVHNDELGTLFKEKLIAAAHRGVRVFFLYDDIGSHALPKRYFQDLKNAGIDSRPFKTTKGAKNRFQLNFRNHRKIVVADGKVAFLGGHNVGDEYMGKSKKFGLWRDTHVRMEGPVVLQVQASFTEDWHWSNGTFPDIQWDFTPVAEPGKAILILPSGPADGLDTCCLFFLQAINSAKERIWITSPYFVPDPQILSALQLAAMRGVDVRIILPCIADHLLVYLASFSYLKDALPRNVRLYRYQGGFLHEKVLLVDDKLSAVGTANFDNRSFRLNFEVTAIFADADFSSQVEKMLLEDLKNSKKVSMSEISERSFFFKVAVQVARLMAPIL